MLVRLVVIGHQKPVEVVDISTGKDPSDNVTFIWGFATLEVEGDKIVSLTTDKELGGEKTPLNIQLTEEEATYIQDLKNRNNLKHLKLMIFHNLHAPSSPEGVIEPHYLEALETFEDYNGFNPDTMQIVKYGWEDKHYVEDGEVYLGLMLLKDTSEEDNDEVVVDMPVSLQEYFKENIEVLTNK